MTAVASITDREDGTGVDVTLATGVDSANVVVYVGRYTGAWTNIAFTAQGTATDLSTIAIDLANGSYVAAFVVSGVPDDVMGFRVTDGTKALHVQCLEAIRSHVLALALPGVPVDPDRHVIHSKPRHSVRELGGDNGYDGVHYWPLPERRTQADNVRDQVTYPVQIVWARANNGTIAVDDAWVKSRQMLSQSFPGCPLAAVSDINQVLVTPAAIYHETGGSLNVDLQSLIFDCLTQQARQVV